MPGTSRRPLFIEALHFLPGVMTAALLAAATQADCPSVTTGGAFGADAQVQGHAPDDNLGAHPMLFVKNALVEPNGVARHGKVYLRFDLSAFNVTAVARAWIQLTIAPGSDGTPPHGPQVFAVWGIPDVSTGATGDAPPGRGGWLEGTGTIAQPSNVGITWNNAPANRGDSGSMLDANAIHLGEFVIDGPGLIHETIQFGSPALDAFVRSDTNALVTIAVTRLTVEQQTGSAAHRFWSYEGSSLLSPRMLVNALTIADITGDCRVDGSDLGVLLAQWGPCTGTCTADLTGDGVVDGADLGLLLAEWG